MDRKDTAGLTESDLSNAGSKKSTTRPDARDENREDHADHPTRILWQVDDQTATDSDERRAIVASVRQQAADASIEAAVKAAVAVFPPDVHVDVSTHGELEDGVGDLTITVTGTKRETEAERAERVKAAATRTDR